MSMIGNFLRVTRSELEAYLKDSSLLEERIYENEGEDPKLTDIDKAWNGILYLLTGEDFENSTHPLTAVIFSGRVIDKDQDLGYGPGNYLTPEEVQDLNTKLSAISPEELIKRYDPKKMANVYPNVWDNENALSYLTDYFRTVQEVYSEAAKNDEGIITFLS